MIGPSIFHIAEHQSKQNENIHLVFIKNVK